MKIRLEDKGKLLNFKGFQQVPTYSGEKCHCLTVRCEQLQRDFALWVVGSPITPPQLGAPFVRLRKFLKFILLLDAKTQHTIKRK